MLDQQSVHEKAKGRWPEILSALGIPESMLNVRKHHPCPWCGGKDRFRFTNQNGSGRFYCGQCGAHSALDFLMSHYGWDFRKAAREVSTAVGTAPARNVTAKKDEKNVSSMRRLWSSSQPLQKADFADKFLSRRGIDLSHLPTCLRKVERAEHIDEDKSKTYWPTMIARITSPAGEGTNIHRTYLTADGNKANVDEPRKIMFGGVEPGSAVRLFDAAPVMGVGEGIETSLSASLLFSIPVWSCLNTSMMKTWEPPELAQRISIFADNDSNGAGQVAAFTLAGRLRARGLDVSVEIPPGINDDWNDVLVAKLMAS